MNNEKVLEILKDQGFAKKILEMQKPEQVQTAFKEKGLDISIDEVEAIGSILNKMIEKKTTNLSEDDLKEIAGGDIELGSLGDLGKGFARGALGLSAAIVDKLSDDNLGLENKVKKHFPKASNVQDTNILDTTGSIAGSSGVAVLGAAALMGAGALTYGAVKWCKKKGN